MQLDDQIELADRKCANGNAVLFQRANSAVWQMRVLDPTGKWTEKSTRQKDIAAAKVAAEAHYRELQLKVAQGIPLHVRSLQSVAERVMTQLQQQIDNGSAKVSYKDYITAIDKYIIPAIGKLPCDRINQFAIAQLDDYRTKKLKRVASKSVINCHNTALNRVLREAIKLGLITKHDLPELENNGRKTEPRFYFDDKQFELIMQRIGTWSKQTMKQKVTQGKTKTYVAEQALHWKNRAYRLLLRDYVMVLTNTGMRPGQESLNLRWCDIETFVQKDDKGIKHKYWKLNVDGKTDERELVPDGEYDDEFWNALKRIRLRFPDLKKMSDDELFKQTDYVFRIIATRKINAKAAKRSQKNKAPEKPEYVTEISQAKPNAMANLFAEFLTEIGIITGKRKNQYTLYSFRHTYATRKLRKKLPIAILAKQMGNSIGVIEDHYSKLVATMNAAQISGRNLSQEEQGNLAAEYEILKNRLNKQDGELSDIKEMLAQVLANQKKR